MTDPQAPVPPQFLALAHRLADAAAAVQRRYFRKRVTVHTKDDESPVTIADREAEAAMRDLIASAFPGHGILGEEHGADRLGAEYVWVLDPVDGTKSFITGRPMFGTLIALMHGGRPVLGIIDQSITHERWVGIEGERSTHNGSPISTRACPRVEDAVMFSTSPFMFEEDEERAGFERLASTVRMPMFGGDCYAYGLLALGFADLVLEASMAPYDYLALVPVIEGAGGRVTGWEGERLGLDGGSRVLAAGDPRSHGQALEILRSSAPTSTPPG